MSEPEVSWVDPAKLYIPSSRCEGADPGKLVRQISRYGNEIVEMPPLWVHSIQQGKLLISDGVTRATRAAKLCPGELVPAIDIGYLNINPKRYSTIEGKRL